jgi:hypothetical protein
MSPANQKKHTDLLRRAAELRAAACRSRESAAYADSSQARGLDEEQARRYEREALALEGEAADLMESDP